MEEVATRSIRREEILQRLGRPDFALVNVLSRRAFQHRRIPKSLSLPLEDLRARATEVVPNRDGTVAVYCASST
ncbi:MAG: rhodanese-like domain-containing protein [Deltaproteobacteria bacterium]|nr:rhodanese-like domain-containing protein [Deltaproteobacteria bacterium]